MFRHFQRSVTLVDRKRNTYLIDRIFFSDDFESKEHSDSSVNVTDANTPTPPSRTSGTCSPAQGGVSAEKSAARRSSPLAPQSATEVASHPAREGPGTVPSPPQSDLRATNGLGSQRGGAYDLTPRRPFCARGSRARAAPGGAAEAQRDIIPTRPQPRRTRAQRADDT